MHRISVSILCEALCAILVCGLAHSATYYVDPANGNNSNPGTIDAPWQTLNYSVRRGSYPYTYLQPGDTLYLRGGEYRGDTNYISLSAGYSGTSNAPITLAAYPGESPIICDSATKASFDLRNKRWWVVDGLTFSNNYRHCWLVNMTNLLLKNCVFDRCNTNSDWQYAGVVLANSGGVPVQYNIISNNVFRWWGWFADNCNDHGVSLSVCGFDDMPHNYNLVVSNRFIGGAHDHLQLSSGYNVIRGNLFANPPWIATNATCWLMNFQRETNIYGAFGNRHTKPGDSTAGTDWTTQYDMRNVFEGNHFLYTGPPSDDNGAFGIELATSRSIYRHNVIAYSLAAGIFFNTSGSYSRSTSNAVYGNVIFCNGLSHIYGGSGMQGFSHGVGTSNFQTDPRRKDNFLVNNIILHNLPANMDARTAQYQHLRGNLTDDAVNPLFISTNGLESIRTATDFYRCYDPNNRPDFRLRSASPCIDAGTWLAYTVGAATNSVVMTLDNSLYFSDGNQIVDGDLIQLQGQAVTSQVVSNDWQNNTLYLRAALTWTNGQGVSLPYYGSAPDQGAFEYRPTGAPDPVARPRYGSKPEP